MTITSWLYWLFLTVPRDAVRGDGRLGLLLVEDVDRDRVPVGGVEQRDVGALRVVVGHLAVVLKRVRVGDAVGAERGGLQRIDAPSAVVALVRASRRSG